MEKVRYETDPFNRLVVKSGRPGLARHRRVLDGNFKIGPGNSLEYHANTPIQDGASAPYRVKLDGRWSVTKDNRLRYVIEAGSKSRESCDITITGAILEAKGDSLVFAAGTRTGDGTRKTYILELSGNWHADESNRLAFSVRRERGQSDTIAFSGSWRTAGDNGLIYRYEGPGHGRHGRRLHTIAFRGRWSVAGPAFVSYSLEAGSNSSFEFRASLGSCGPDFARFELGAGVARRLRPAMKALILYGNWRISRDSGLTFDIECADGRIYSMEFGAEARLATGDRITFKLKDPALGKGLGAELTLSHEMLGGDGSAFILMLKSSGESAVLVGSAFRW